MILLGFREAPQPGTDPQGHSGAAPDTVGARAFPAVAP
jgi:hypothetical protein